MKYQEGDLVWWAPRSQGIDSHKGTYGFVLSVEPNGYRLMVNDPENEPWIWSAITSKIDGFANLFLISTRETSEVTERK